MDKNLLRAQLLMEAADLLNEESYEDYEDFEDYEELYESSRKPNTNERYALTKGYVSETELQKRDNAARWYPGGYRRILSKAPGVAYAKREMDQNNNTYFKNPSKSYDLAKQVVANREKDYKEWHGDLHTKKALQDRLAAANHRLNSADSSRYEIMGWMPEYNDAQKGKYVQSEDEPGAHWKKMVKAEGQDPWRQYPRKRKGLFGK